MVAKIWPLDGIEHSLSKLQQDVFAPPVVYTWATQCGGHTVPSFAAQRCVCPTVICLELNVLRFVPDCASCKLEFLHPDLENNSKGYFIASWDRVRSLRIWFGQGGVNNLCGIVQEQTQIHRVPKIYTF